MAESNVKNSVQQIPVKPLKVRRLDDALQAFFKPLRPDQLRRVTQSAQRWVRAIAPQK